MIEVTDEMVQAYKDAWAGNHCSQAAGIEAALLVIDPVPNDVKVIYDRADGEYTRLAEGGNVWRAECGCCVSTYQDLVEDNEGPLSWSR